MRYLRGLVAVAAALALGACATTSGTAARTDVSRFDGSRNVEIDPHGTFCGYTQTVCPMVGALWNSAHPADAFLVIGLLGEYTGIHDAQVRIEGKTYTLPHTNAPTQFSNIDAYMALAPATRESRQYFLVPLALVRAMASAQQVSLRVDTPTGYVDATIIDSERDTKAYNALKRFLVQVDQGAAR